MMKNAPGSSPAADSTARPRRNLPTLADAFEAARGLTSDPAAQIEIAAGLIGVPVEEARQMAPAFELVPATAPTQTGRTEIRTNGSGRRPLVVERVRRTPLSRASA